jgi:hypothetical protein
MHYTLYTIKYTNTNTIHPTTTPPIHYTQVRFSQMADNDYLFPIHYALYNIPTYLCTITIPYEYYTLYSIHSIIYQY